MKKPFYTIFAPIILIGLLLSSCGKDGLFSSKTKAEGTILYERTRVPVPDAMVELREEEANILDGPGPIVVTSQKTDANGRFSISFPSDHKRYLYSVIANKAGYGNYLSYYEMNQIPEGGRTDIEILLRPRSFIKLHFINSIGGLSFKLYENGKSYNLQPGADTIFKPLEVRGNATNTVSYWITAKDSVERKYTDQVYVPELDTIVHPIRY